MLKKYLNTQTLVTVGLFTGLILLATSCETVRNFLLGAADGEPTSDKPVDKIAHGVGDAVEQAFPWVNQAATIILSVLGWEGTKKTVKVAAAKIKKPKETAD